MRQTYLAIILILTLAVPGWTADYYVDSAVTDTNPSSATPDFTTYNPITFETTGGSASVYKTLADLNACTFSAGDTIYFRKGQVFSGYFCYTNVPSGSAGSFITFSSFGSGNKPILCRSTNQPVGSWTNLGGSPTRYRITYTDTTSMLYEDWRPLTQASDANLTDGYWYFDDANNYIYYRSTDGTFDTELIYTSDGAGPVYINGAMHHVAFRNLKFVGVLPLSAVDYFTFDSITIDSCDFAGANNAIFFKEPTDNTGTYIEITNCSFQYNYSNIYLIAETSGSSYENCLIHNNSFLKTTYTYMDGSWASSEDSDGISIQNCKDTVISNNEISGKCNKYAGINIWYREGFAGTGNIIKNNFIHNIQGCGIIHGGADNGTCNVKIYNNIIYNYTAPVSSYEEGAAIECYRNQTSATPSLIYNNTISGGPTGIYVGGSYYTVKNNVVYDCDVLANNTGNANIIIDYNCYYPVTGTPFKYNGVDKSFANWQSISSDTDFAVHDMTSNNSHSPYVAAESGSLASPTFDAWNCFNAPTGNERWVDDAVTGWVSLDLGSGNAKRLYSYSIMASAWDANPDREPNSWTMEGSNNGSDWTVIDTVTGQTSWGSGEVRNFVCDTYTTDYRYFRLNISANNGDVNYLQVCEIYLYERTTITHDTNGIASDPAFVNAGGSYALATDFKVLRTSPAARAGSNLYSSGITTDHFGNARYNESPWAIGAHQPYLAITTTPGQ